MNSRLDDALIKAPRTLFLPDDQKRFAKVDAPLPIGFGVTNSQPRTVRDMLELLGVHRRERVLDVGSGSGWTTALLAELVGPSGSVYAVERIPDLVARSRKVLSPWSNISIHTAKEGTLGLPAHGPYDRILVSAMADEIPAGLVSQLRCGGTMVIPVSSVMLKVQKGKDGQVLVSEHGFYSFVPLLP